LVVFYDSILSEIMYIYRGCRTGGTAGRVIILAASDAYDMIYLYASYLEGLKNEICSN